jgi:hypothetical protein
VRAAFNFSGASFVFIIPAEYPPTQLHPAIVWAYRGKLSLLG